MQTPLVLLIAGFSYWFAALSGVPKYISGVLFKFGIKRKIEDTVPFFVPIRLYPIDCEKCLGFWLGLYYFWSSENYIMVAGCVSLTTMVLGFIINKLR